MGPRDFTQLNQNIPQEDEDNLKILGLDDLDDDQNVGDDFTEEDVILDGDDDPIDTQDNEDADIIESEELPDANDTVEIVNEEEDENLIEELDDDDLDIEDIDDDDEW